MMVRSALQGALQPGLGSALLSIMPSCSSTCLLSRGIFSTIACVARIRRVTCQVCSCLMYHKLQHSSCWH